MKHPDVTRLTDEEIRSIFRTIAEWPGPEKETFIRAYANAVLKAAKEDFIVLRPVTLVFIAKYNLLGYRQEEGKKRSFAGRKFSRDVKTDGVPE